MSTLRSTLDELRSSDVVALGDDELVGDLDELERAGRMIEAERGRRLAELERRGTWAADGHLSLAAWLADRHRVAHGTAAARVRLGRAMLQMPETAEALAAGEVSSTAATLLADARESCPQAFDRFEPALVEVARTRPVVELRRDLELWRHAVDRLGAADEHERRFERRRLDLGPTLDGMVRVAGELDPETGQTVITALRAIQDADVREAGARPDLRTPTQRRADALGELCRAWLDRSDRPALAGERPHVVVTVDLEAFRRRDGLAELDDVGPVTAEVARRLACDASVTRVVAAGRSAPLDVGRRTKVVPPPLRRALVVRDRGCRFPGCDRPPGWCDAHHVRHWADGGRTALDNLVLLCRRHHRIVHHRRFRIEILDGHPAFSRPDGSPIEAHVPP